MAAGASASGIGESMVSLERRAEGIDPCDDDREQIECRRRFMLVVQCLDEFCCLEMTGV